MQFYLQIKPSFDCLVKCRGLEKELSKDKIFTFLTNFEDKLTLLVYPLEDNLNSLPYACTLQQNLGKLFTTSKCAEIIAYPNNNYMLTLSPFYFLSAVTNPIKSISCSFGGETHQIYYSKNLPCSVFIENNNNASTNFCYNKKINELKTKTINNKLLCILTLEDNSYLLAIIVFENNKYHQESILYADLLEEEKNIITIYKNQNDFSGHGLITKIDCTNNFSLTQQIVYNNDFPTISTKKELIPFAFFEAIKIQNFKLARCYMAEELNKRLKDLHLKNFFGKFINISQTLSTDYCPNDIALIYEGQPKYAKIFHLELNENNKICNIIEN